MIEKIKSKFVSINELDKKLYKTILTNYVAKGISLVTNLLVVPLILNYLGAEKYGFLITLLTVLNWLFIFDFGIGNSVKNLISQSTARNDTKETNDIFSNASFLLFFIFILFSVLTFFLVPIVDWQGFFKINTISKQELILVMEASFVLFLLNMFLSLGSNVFYGFQKGYLPNIFNTVGSIISLVLIYLSITNRLSIPFIIILYLSGFLIGNFLSFLFLVITKFIHFSKRSLNKASMIVIFNLGIKFFGVSVISIVIYTVDNILITRYLGPKQIAIYNPIMRLNQIILQANGLYFLSLWPAYTNAIAKKDWAWIRGKLRNSLKIILFIFTPPVLILMMFGPQIIKVWIGAGNAIPSRLLCFTIGLWTIIYLVNQACSTFLNGAGIMGQQIKFGAISIFIFIGVGYFLINRFGLIGLSIAGICSSSVGLIVNPYLINKYLKNIKE